MSFLFDTDVLSNPLKKRPSEKLLDRLSRVPPEEQFTTSITVGEMTYGAHKSMHPKRFLHALETQVWPTLTILPFDQEAAVVYGRIRAELEQSGVPLAEPDLRIAAIALSNGLTLVTGNEGHFYRVPGIQLENWLV